jgi:hypothetical protein
LDAEKYQSECEISMKTLPLPSQYPHITAVAMSFSRKTFVLVSVLLLGLLFKQSGIAAVPPVPASLTLTPELTTGNLPQMRLDWPIVSTATSYRMRRHTAAVNGTTTQLSPNPVSNTFTDKGGTGSGSPALAFNTTYWWNVAGANGAGVGTYTARTPGVTLPGPPTQPTVVSGNQPQVALTWTWAVGGNALGILNYRVKRSASASGPFTLVTGGTPTSPAFTDTTVSPNSQYYYVISAVTASGEGPNSSVSSVATTPPGVPTALTMAPANGAPVLSWAAPAGTAPTSYRVYRTTVFDSATVSLVGNPTTTSFSDLTAPNERVLYYFVTAVNAGGEGKPSSTNTAMSTYRRLPKLFISEIFANPSGSPDPATEYVELVATEAIDFSVNHYCVVFSSNGAADEDGWIGGCDATYGFNITSGTVARGGVVYVGGSAMTVGAVATKVRTINNIAFAGDRFGALGADILGNGGSDADGVAVFDTDIWNLKGSTVPVDAVFFGTGTGAPLTPGTAIYDFGGGSEGVGGYQLPVNDIYSGGKLQRNSSFVTVDPGGGEVIVATGTYNPYQDAFSANRTWAVAAHTDGTSAVAISPVNANAPTFTRVPERFSGTFGDVNPQLTFSVLPTSATAVGATSGNQGIVPNANLIVTPTGTPGEYRLAITPAASGYALITISATANGVTSTIRLQYAASFGGNGNTKFYTFASDASASFPLSANYMLVGDDEDQVIRLYDRTASGAPLKVFDMTRALGLTDRKICANTLKEVDIEGATSMIINPGAIQRIFWIGALANEDDGDDAPSRNRLFATDVVGTDINSYNLAYAGRYDFLRQDLLAWDLRNDRVACGGTPIPANYYGFATSAADGKNPKSIDGFNIEGLAMAPDGVTAYIGFRAPYSPTATRTRALIVPLLNINALLSNPGGGAVGSAIFGAPIELDLGNRGIRSIEGNQYGMLIVAGAFDNAIDFRLFTWAGTCGSVTEERVANLAGMNLESIVEIPSTPLNYNSVVQLLSDNGRTVWHPDGLQAKALPDPFTKFRSDQVQIGVRVNWAEAGRFEMDDGWDQMIPTSSTVDSAGNVYVAGYFWGQIFFGGATIASDDATKIFVLKLNPDGGCMWAGAYGGPPTPESTGASYSPKIAVDGSGNVYLTGIGDHWTQWGSVTMSGGNYAVIAKLDSNGNILWAKQATGGSSSGQGIKLSSSGDVFVTGNLNGGPVNFGATSLSSAGAQDVFVTKLDANGNFSWAIRAGGSSSEAVRGVGLDSSGNIYISGYFGGGDATFGAITLTASGNTETFIAKLNSSGVFLWANRATTTSPYGNYCFDLAVDPSGNSYITGQFYTDLTLGATTLVGSMEDYSHGFISKLDANGNFMWAAQSTGGNERANALTIDGFGNVYVTGYYSPYLAASTFGTTTLPAPPEYQGWNTFVTKLNNNGAFIWAKATVLGQPSAQNYSAESQGNAVSVDSLGNVYVTGQFAGGLIVDGVSLYNDVNYDTFVSKLRLP